MAVRRARRAQDEKEKREEEFLPSLDCVAPVNTHAHTQQQAHGNTIQSKLVAIDPRQHENKSTGQHKEFIASINRQKCAQTAQTLLFASVFILTLEEDFKLVSSVGDAVKNDIIVSWAGFAWIFFFHLLFSLSTSGLFVWKNQERSISQVYCVPAFPASESSVYLCIFFLISIFVGATAQHPQHTDDKGSGRGVQKVGGVH